MFTLPLTDISAPGLVDKIHDLGNDIVGCELGVCRGHNLRYLLDRVSSIKTVYAIDPYIEYQEWCGFVNQNQVNEWMNTAVNLLLPHDDKIIFLKTTSNLAKDHIPDLSLDYIFIDGDHSYQSVKTDCINYFPKVKKYGLFSGHDYQLAEVKQAVTEFKIEFDIQTPLQFTDNNVWYWYKD